MAYSNSGGMPRAWSHRTDMAAEGFTNPDDSRQCYISFLGYSPVLSTVNGSIPNNNETDPLIWYTFTEDVNCFGPCSYFIMMFYDYALNQGYSVHDSLDNAAWDFFECDYTSCALNEGYQTWWPGGGDMEGMENPGYYPEDYPEMGQTYANKMRIFGDSDIKLHQPQLTLSGRNVNNNNPCYPTFTINGSECGVGNWKVVYGTYTFNAYDTTHYAFSHFSYQGNNYSRPTTLAITSDSELIA